MGCSGSTHKDQVEEVVSPSQRRHAVPSEKVLKTVVPSEDQWSTLSTRDGASLDGDEVRQILDERIVPTWNKKVLSSGADKDIFAGTFKGKPVAVCVAKPRGSGWTRIQNEIQVFKTLGKHPHIVEMYCSGMTRGSLYFALEVVEPIGYDLDRLKNMYSFAGQTVPSSLMARIFRQLISALSHMHKKRLIHRDLKTENILINDKHEAKVIDMGIACKVGTRDPLRAGYLAPELCEGRAPLGVKVDSWGLGIILHQVYQNQWKVLTESGPVAFLDGKPSAHRPMEKPVREAMCGLLQLHEFSRWSLTQLLECDWLSRPESPQAAEKFLQPAVGEDSERRYLRRYATNKPLPSALAVFISAKNHAHLIGKPINALGLSSGLGITVLLINYGEGSYERSPGGDTLIKENSWVYFGVPQGEGLVQKAVAGLEEVLSPHREKSFCRPTRPNSFRALNKQEVVETGKLVEFTVEFDCFSFPSHIGTEAVIGCSGNKTKTSASTPPRALHLRRAFRVNLVGIQRLGETEPEWFPRANVVVRPDDLGLVVRLPCTDGSTQPTLTDEDLQGLMEEQKFHAYLQQTQQRPVTSALEVARSRSNTEKAIPTNRFSDQRTKYEVKRAGNARKTA